MMDHCDCFDETMFDVYDESESVNAGELGCITRGGTRTSAGVGAGNEDDGMLLHHFDFY